MALKDDNGWRSCRDYLALNAHTAPGWYPLYLFSYRGSKVYLFSTWTRFDPIWTVWIPFFMTYGLCKAGLTFQRFYWWSNIRTGFLLFLCRQQFGIFKFRRALQEPPTGTVATFLRVRSYHKPFKVYILPKCTHWRDMTTPYFGPLKLNFLYIWFIPEEHNHPKRELQHFKNSHFPRHIVRYLQHFLGMRISTEDVYPIQLNFKFHYMMIAMIKPKHHPCTMDSFHFI